MRTHTKRKELNARMPSVPVSSEFKGKFQDVARASGISVSELVRLAMTHYMDSLFLSGNYSETIVKYSDAKNEPPPEAA